MIAVAGVVVAPNLVPAALTTTRAGGMPGYWFDAMQWLRTKTPEPFGSADALLRAIRRQTNPPAGFTVMNWWDQGYWIIQTGAARAGQQSHARRRGEGGAVPDRDRRSDALDELTPDRARYVIVDWELPFRDGADGALAGRFQNLADWAGIPTSRYLLAVLLAADRRAIRGSRRGSIASLLPDRWCTG